MPQKVRPLILRAWIQRNLRPHRSGSNCGSSQGQTLAPPPRKKKVWSKESDGPHFPSSELPFPSIQTTPDQPPKTTKSPYRSQRFSTIPIQTSSRFSRCRRPSLSSKRPLRACQLTPARLQSSSLNEIPNPARPSTKFSQTFTVSSPYSPPDTRLMLAQTNESLPLS